jgi:hypothetical protein
MDSRLRGNDGFGTCSALPYFLTATNQHVGRTSRRRYPPDKKRHTVEGASLFFPTALMRSSLLGGLSWRDESGNLICAFAEEVLLHLFGKIFPGIRIDQAQTVFVDQHRLDFHPLLPCLLGHIFEDALAEFSGQWREIETFGLTAKLDAVHHARHGVSFTKKLGAAIVARIGGRKNAHDQMVFTGRSSPENIDIAQSQAMRSLELRQMPYN